MQNFDDVIINKRVRLLREKIEEQKKILLELIEQWYHYRYVVQPRILFEYEKIFGELENELEEKTEICSKIERKVELFFVKISRGMKITRDVWNIIEKSVESNFQASQRNFVKGNKDGNALPLMFQQSSDKSENLQSELVKMYRQLVKKLHPDVAGENEFFKKFWISIQDAYKERNYAKIRVFYKLLNSDLVNFEYEEDVIRKLEDELKEFKLMVNIEKRIIERMLNREPFTYEQNLKNPLWIEQHKAELKKKINFLEKQIDFNSRLLKKIEENIEDDYR